MKYRGGLLVAALVLACAAPAAAIDLGGQQEGHSLRSSLLTDKENPVEKKTTNRENVKEAATRSRESVGKISSMPARIEHSVEEDADVISHSFLPGLDIHQDQVILTCVATLLSLIWFYVYFNMMYKDDINPRNQRLAAQAMAPELEATTSLIQSDLVLVFAHPGDKTVEKTLEKPISSASIKNVLVVNEASGGVLRRTEALLQNLNEFESKEASLSVMERAGHARDAIASMVKTVTNEEATQPTKGNARTELLLDLYDAVLNMGFEVDIFSSVDFDEIYMCISLKSSAVAGSYLLQEDARLQVKQSVVAALGINQPPDEIASSPPFIRYDPRIPEKLHAAGVLDSSDPRKFYETFHWRDPKGTVVCGCERIRAIYKALSQHIDLDAAKHEGLLEHWYPAHSPGYLVHFWKVWGHWSNLKDLTFVQPLQELREYFGLRIAFSYGWNGFYCKALLPLAAIAIVSESIALVCKIAVETDVAETNRKLIFSFGVVIIIWSKIAANLWDREQLMLMKIWGLNEENEEFLLRPSFQGEMLPSPANLNVKEKQCDPAVHTTRRLLSDVVTLVFCGVVFFWVVAWTNMFEGRMDIYASICLSLQIVFFGLIWNELTPVLTEWENHKYQNTYYDSYLWKQCLFQAVNNYSAFFYLAVKQRYTSAGCPEGGCLIVLRMQLIMSLIILAGCAIAQVLLSGVLVSFALWQEDSKIEQASKDEKFMRYYTEEQSKLTDYRLREQIQSMVQLVIALGFVLFFGAVVPVTIPLCLLVFVISLRSSAYMLLTYTKRPPPRKQMGIGRWRQVIQMFMYGNVLFTAILTISYRPGLRSAPTITKLSVMVLFWLGSEVLWRMVDHLFPAHDAFIDVLAARRKCTLKAIARRCERARTEMLAGTSPRKPNSPLPKSAGPVDQALRNGDWLAIPCLQDIHETRSAEDLGTFKSCVEDAPKPSA